MTKLTRYALAASILLLPAASVALGAPATADEILKALADKLLDEAERQHMVNRRMDVSIGAFDALVKDLKSNDLFSQGRGPEMGRFAKVLGVLSTRHVPNAEKYLQEARKRLAALRPNVVAADGEIKIILKLLDELLKKAEEVSASDDLLTQLRLIIRNEQNLHEQTREWGKLLYKKPEEAEADRQELENTQKQIAASVRQFEADVKSARQEQADPMRRQELAKAAKAMDEKKIDKKLDKAANDIATKKPVPAVQKQKEALDALRDLEKMLEEDSLSSQIEEMKATHEDLSEILARQEELRKKTEEQPADKFAPEAPKLQIEQHNLKKELDKTQRNMPEAALPEVQQPVQQAQKHMQEATDELAKTQQDPAVEEQKKAEESLKKALKNLNEQIAQAESQMQAQQELAEAAEQLEQQLQQTQALAQRQRQLMQATQQAQPQQLASLAQPQADLAKEAGELSEESEQGSEPLEEAASEMAEASQSLEQGQQTDAQQHQAQALQALQQAAQSLQQAMQQQAPPVPNQQPTTDPDEQGSRDFGKQKPGGPKPPRAKRLWDHLNPKEREALRQSFARDLPLEYRELLEDYYEALSK